MSKNAKSGSNTKYIFANQFDAILYAILSGFYPLVSLWIQLFQTPTADLRSVYDLLLSGAFFAFSFFYDFYSRFRDCEEGTKTKMVLKLLFWGRNLFLVLTFAILISVLLINKNMVGTTTLTNSFFAVAIIGLYPFIISLIEIISRTHAEINQKISKACI